MENRKSFSITTRGPLNTLGWFKTSSSSPAAPSLRATATPECNHHQTTREKPQLPLPPVPPETCVVLKHLVDFLIKHKLHKTDLFLHGAKPRERAKLLVSIHRGEPPTKLRQFSSRSVSSVVSELLTQSFATLLPHTCITELLRLSSDGSTDKTCDSRVACIVHAMSHVTCEQSALLVSLLELLHKLSLHATGHMNASVLGKCMAAALFGSTQDAQCEAVATFLIEKSPEILVCIQEAPGNSTAVATTHSLPLAIAQHETRGLCLSLDVHTAANVTVVLTAIIESRSSKHGLFLEGTRHDWDHDERRQRQRVASLLLIQREGAMIDSDLDAVRSYSAVALSRGLRDFLGDHMHPLLSLHVDLELDHSLDDRTVVVGALQYEIVNRLAAYAQHVLLLLLVTVRLALDAGTDRRALVAALAPCLLESRSRSTAIQETWTDVLFAEMHVVMRPLCRLPQERATRAPARRLCIAVLVLLWIVKLRQRQRERRQHPDENGKVAIPEIVVPVVLEAETSYAGTLSEWLLLVSQDPMTGLRGTILRPPRAYDAAELASSLVSRLDDIVIVMSHCRNDSRPAAIAEPTHASDQLVDLLDYLDVAPALISRQNARATLAKIQQTNRTSKTYVVTGATVEWATLEILETFVVETLHTLAHPALAPLYPTFTSQLVVLLDIWGLADQTIALGAEL